MVLLAALRTGGSSATCHADDNPPSRQCCYGPSCLTRRTTRVDAVGMRVRLPFAVLCCALALVLISGSSSAEEKPQRQGTWYPGLPYAECRPFAWAPGTCEGTPNVQEDFTGMNVMQTGMTGSSASKQWARVPIGLLAANSAFTVRENDAGGNDSTVDVWAHFVSPRGSRHNYGQSPRISVRTVAFGAIPATVVLQISQKRDSADLPIPFYLHLVNSSRGTTEFYPSTEFSATVDVAVRSVTVDGQDIRLGEGCLATDARIETASRPVSFPVGEPPPPSVTDFDPSTSFVALQGGQLDGTIDVPRFRGCTTASGDDISPLLTTAISGAGNPLSLRIGSLGCQFYEEGTGRSIPPAPGTSPKTLGPKCPADLNQPYNPRIRPVPEELPFPGEAP